MFVRKKNNPSGVVSIQIVDKSRGKYRVIKTIGSSSFPEEVSRLYNQGKKWIALQRGERDMFIDAEEQREEKQVTDYLLNNIENILLNGTQLILEQVFKLVGFDTIDDDILKHFPFSALQHLKIFLYYLIQFPLLLIHIEQSGYDLL